MDARKLIFIIPNFFLCLSCSAYEFREASEITLFKNYALAACTASSYKEDSIYEDAVDVLNGNREQGSIALEAYHDLNQALAQWSQKKYISKSGNVSEFFMCVDFHNSQEVMNIFNTYNPCKNKQNWGSEKEFEIRCMRSP